MRLTTAKKLRESDRRKIWLTCRRITALLGICVFMGQTIQADTVQISEVVQRVNTLDLSLRNLSQDPISPDVKVSGTTGNGGSKGGAKTDSLLSGAIVDSQTQPIGVEVVADAIVEGTVCDCGEILVPGGAFPKWPLLFLAGIPLIFIPHDDSPPPPPTNPICTNCVITPLSSPSPPPNSTVPEPASLFLFGAGLLAFGAGLRRRYAKAQFATENQTKDE